MAGKGGDRDRASRPVLGGGAGASGLPGADSQWLHLPFHSTELEAAEAGLRGRRGRESRAEPDSGPARWLLSGPRTPSAPVAENTPNQKHQRIPNCGSLPKKPEPVGSGKY